MADPEPLIFIINGKVVPKQRPQVSGKVARYSEGYSDWKRTAKLALQAEIATIPARVTQMFPLLSPVRIDIEFWGSLRGNADLDNAQGSWLDAMVQAEILGDDNIKNVIELRSTFLTNSEPYSVIGIYPNWVITPSLWTVERRVRYLQHKQAIGA